MALARPTGELPSRGLASPTEGTMTLDQLAAAARRVSLGVAVVAGGMATSSQAGAQTLLDDSLSVSTTVSGLSQPITMAFIGPDDILVTEKASGQVKRVTGGVVTGVVLDLAVNSASERGLLGIALHPDFPDNPGVYLFNTESTTGADTNAVAEVPLLGNRVDRFVWNGATLTFDRNIIRLRAFQNDRNNVANPTLPVLRGNHNGGVLRFGPDGKLYMIIGDNGRRGWMQNNLAGPVPDDDFGGPAPDDAHLTGVILRLNDDGSTPTDNPFYVVGAHWPGGAAATRGRGRGATCSASSRYGVRNSFGMTFDPKTGGLWTTENGGRAFDEINHVEPGFNGGWIQVMGPLHRVSRVQGDRNRRGRRAPTARTDSSSCAGRRPTSPTRPQRRAGRSSHSPARTYATRRSAGSKWCRRPAWASSTAPASVRSTTAT